MITKDCIDRIFDAARIEEVVGDFVSLKKRGSNWIGLCPFHNEKTPSFNVNQARNIYKCFGCGKGGNAVNFVMEHEHYSYPEALRYLANRYSIEIEETAPDPKEAELRDEKESLFIVNTFAQKTFTENLLETEEGKAVGLSYFKERGFSDETIRKFELGYSLNDWSAFYDHAVKQAYQEEFLVKTGLVIRKESENEDSPEKQKVRHFDRFRGRVMFPIHNLSGRVIGFGGRILKKDEKAAKYLNSPESEIYHKSKSLYGIFFAKKTIVLRDTCYLVEGYTDVISLHQAGIENVVASSGTSLTSEQIRLIGRYTKNITVLYDGDPAGIKASLRGIDLILEEGLNVRVVLFPDGEDPDSYTRKYGAGATLDLIEKESQDFIVFKTGLLLNEVQNDPVRKAGLIRDVVETIAKIPDPIIRATYTKQCAALMEIQEHVLLAEQNKVRRKQLKKEIPVQDAEELMGDILLPHHQINQEMSTEEQEKNIIRLLLNFAHLPLSFEDTGHSTIPVSQFIVDEIANDGITFENTLYNSILDEFRKLTESQNEIHLNHFLNSHVPEVSKLAVEMLSQRYFLSDNWEAMHKIIVPREEDIMKESVEKSVYYLKKKKVMRMLEENQRKIKEAHQQGEDFTELMEMHKRLENVKMEISKVLGIDILK